MSNNQSLVPYKRSMPDNEYYMCTHMSVHNSAFPRGCFESLIRQHRDYLYMHAMGNCCRRYSGSQVFVL